MCKENNKKVGESLAISDKICRHSEISDTKAFQYRPLMNEVFYRSSVVSHKNLAKHSHTKAYNFDHTLISHNVVS